MALRQLILDPSALVSAYVSGRSALSLSEESECSLNTVLRRLREQGVEIRQVGRQEPLRAPLTDPSRFVEILDGLLLGDGSINVAGSLRLGQTRKHGSWVQEVATLLSGVGVSSKIIPVRPRKKPSVIDGRLIKSSGSWVLYTPQYQETKEQRDRWYPRGEKRVPQDVRFTDLSVALWFCGDGSYGDNGTLSFCTQGFSRGDVQFLASAFESFGVQASVKDTSDGPVVAIYRRNDALCLAKRIKQHVSDVFQYKLRYVKAAIPRGRTQRKLTSGQVADIRARYTPGSGAALGREFGVSKTTINNIVRGLVYK